MPAVSAERERDIALPLRSVLTAEDRERLAADAAALRDVYGPRWLYVPHGHGPAARAARTVLSTGLLPIDVDQSDAVRIVQEVGAFVATTSQLAAKLLDECRLLGEVFAVDLSMLSLRRLRRIGRAVLALADAPPFPSSWAIPAEAQAAEVVLAALGDDLRELSRLRRELYEEFTEAVWTVTGRGLRARRALANVTRTGRAPADAKRALAMLRRARELNNGVDDAWTAVRGHLGHFAAQGIPDVDGANDALAAVRDLQLALGDGLDIDKLRDLVIADAFVADEVVAPARTIVALIDSWELKANRFGGVNPTRYSPEHLASWSTSVATSLEVLARLREATAPLRATVRTAGQILDDAILRDRVYELCETIPGAMPA